MDDPCAGAGGGIGSSIRGVEWGIPLAPVRWRDTP